MNRLFAPFSRWLALLFLLAMITPLTTLAAGGTYDKLEAQFQLPHIQGNPFDFTQNDVQAKITAPDNSQVTVPAFFDGNQTWHIRFTPTAPGRYVLGSITVNGQDARPQNLIQNRFDVSGPRRPGFIRLDPHNPMRFIFDDGSPYYPLGYNLAWRAEGMGPLTHSLGLMGQAGVNWTRIWMNNWDGKNLDWSVNGADQPPLGTLSLAVARRWDDIVAAADANAIHFQLVLQHHGQYSSRTNPNWPENPWNKANGGWLENPVQFFTDPKAKALTRAKYRYIIARWGYSPAIMAWEIFNEVEYTDAFEKDLDAVAAWHKEMAAFLRQQDPYHHLITTSSRVTEPKIWPAMDYYQSHTYPPDIISAPAALDSENLSRAYFIGEIGSAASVATAGAANARGESVHQAIWSSLMSNASGAAQCWAWESIEPRQLYQYTAAQQFIQRSGLLGQPDAEPIEVTAQTAKQVGLTFSSGLGWAASKGTEFTVKASGFVQGLGGMSAYLQGDRNRAMFPFAIFHVDYATAGTFSVRLDEMTPLGANLVAGIDGAPVATLNMAPPPAPPMGAPGGPGARQPPRNPRFDTTLELPVSAGRHAIRLDNTGPDWVHIREITLAPYAPQLAVLARGNKDSVFLWVYPRQLAPKDAVLGTLFIPGLSDGTYKATWWDTSKGRVVREQTLHAASNELTNLQPPPLSQDLALWIAH